MPFDLSGEQTRQQGGKRILRFAKCKTYRGFRQTLFLVFLKISAFFFVSAPSPTPGRWEFGASSAPPVDPRCSWLTRRTVSISVGRPVSPANKYQAPVKSLDGPRSMGPVVLYVKKIFRLGVQNKKTRPKSSVVPTSSRIPIALPPSWCSLTVPTELDEAESQGSREL